MNLDRYAKAIVSAALAGMSTAYTAMLDNQLTGPEWLLIAGSVLGSLVLVWGVPNAPNGITVVATPTSREAQR